MTYASAWIFVQRADRRVVLDERAAADDDVVADRDALAHARLVAEDHARADARPGEDDRAGRDDRAVADLRRRQRLPLRRRPRRERRLLADDRVLEHLHALAEHRPRVDDRRRVDLSRHAATPSSRSSARTTRAPVDRDARAAVAVAAHEARNALALELQRLVVRDLRAEDVAGARAPLAVGLATAATAPCRRPSPCARAPCRRRRPSSRVPTTVILPHLVRVEPREVHVRDLPRREAQVAEDDVLDAARQEVASVRDRLDRAPRRAGGGSPRGRGRRATRARSRSCRIDAEVLAVAVDAEDVSELAGVDELLQLHDGRVVEQEVARHEREPVAVRAARRARPSRRRASRAASRRTRACPASSARIASS